MLLPGCNHADCSQKAIHLSEYCFKHQKDTKKYLNECYTNISNLNIIKEVNLSYIPFNNFDFSDKKIFYSHFTGCEFHNSIFKNTVMIGTFLDYSKFSDLKFDECSIDFSVFGGFSKTI